MNIINLEKYINSLDIIDVRKINYFDICAKEICKQYNFSLRQINRYFNLIQLVYNYINSENKMREPTLAKYLLFPILLGIKINDVDTYNRIIHGIGEDELKKIIMNNSEITNVFNNYFNGEYNDKELLFDFSKLYELLFVEIEENEWADFKIGNKDIKYGKERKILLSLLSFLNDFIQL